ncbi:MAG TPA: PAS domain-containing protein, partial [Acidobacteriota bacterium]|nr:PAS domain-containing protein [Acidobacteriota bacterium]
MLFTKQAYSQTPVGIVASLVNGIILVAALWAVVPTPTLLLWYASLSLVMGIRFINWMLYRQADVSVDQTRPWIYQFYGVILLSAIVWGAAGVFLFPQDQIAHQVFLVFILGGMVAGAAAILAHFPLAFTLYAPPVVLPLSVVFLSTGARIAQAMGALLLIFTIVMAVFCLRVHRMLRDTYLSRLRNRRLVKRMARARDLAEDLNERLRAEIKEREKTERELQQHRQDLEALVQARTQEVREVNQDLQRQIELYHRSEAALKESEERFRTIFETATDAIFLKNRKGRYLLVNPAMETLFQIPESEFLRLTDEELFEPTLRNQLAQGDSKVIGEGQVFQEEIVADLESRSLVLNMVKVPVRDPQGKVIGLCGIARDV